MNDDTDDLDVSSDQLDESPPLQNMPAPYFRGFGEAIASSASFAYNRAMLKVQCELEALIIADRANPFTKSRFASLGQLLATIRPVLNKNGFLLKQLSGSIRSHGSTTKRWYSSPIITIITHVESGQWEAVVVDLPTEPTVYSHGSALTFGKRYGLQSYLCIATVDDDGAATIQNRLDETHNAKVVEAAIEEIRRCKNMSDLNMWLEENRDALNNLPDSAGLAAVRIAFAERKKALEQTHEPTSTTDGASKAKRRPRSEGEVGQG
jgi:ERF superfamily